MANNGANFATWLRDALMKHYNLYHTEAVYVDFIVARSRLTRHALHFAPNDIQKLNGEVVANISPDHRPHMKSSTGAFPIGATRSDWNEWYREAMSAAKVMVFIYTNEFVDSQWCRQELIQFHKENTLRQINKKPLLRGIFLELDPVSRPNLYVQQAHITRVKASKVNGKNRGLSWDNDNYTISLKAFYALVSAIGSV